MAYPDARMIKVLHFDSRPHIAERVRQVLAADAGEFRLEQVDTAAAALSRIDAERSLGDHVVLVGMSGRPHEALALLATLRARVARIALVALFEACDEVSLLNAFKAGADDYMRDTDRDLSSLPNVIRAAFERNHRADGPRRNGIRVLYVAAAASVATARAAMLARIAPHLAPEPCVGADAAVALLTDPNPAAQYDVVVLDLEADPLALIDAAKALRDRVLPGGPMIVVARASSELLEVAASRLDLCVLSAESTAELRHLPALIEQAHAGAQLARERAQLRESERRRLVALEAGTMTDWHWDIANDHIQWGREPVWMLGPPVDGAYPELRQLVHPDDRERFLQAGQRSIREGVPYDVEFRLARTDGEVRWLLAQGQPVHGVSGEVIALTGVTLDITDRKHAEALLRGKDERLRALIDHSPALISLTDTSGRYLVVNRRFAEAIGTSPELVVGQSPYDIFAERYANVFAEHAIRVVRGARAISMEEGFPAADGELSYYTTRFPIYGADGTLVATGAIATDITALRRAEEELTRLNAELELRVSERTSELSAVIRELESFAHTIAHDLRAPARAMSGFASVMLNDPALCTTEEGQRMLRRIEHNALHMQQLIEDVLQMARAGNTPLKRTLTDLTALARDAFDLTHAMRDNRPLVPTINALGHARVDPGLFRQVFVNLFANAIKFTRVRREVVVEVGRRVQDAETVWFVRDNGVGFDMRNADRLFRAFQRLHPEDEFEGSGIGLAHAARIVERHGGRIWAEAEPGKGATFLFTIGG